MDGGAGCQGNQPIKGLELSVTPPVIRDEGVGVEVESITNGQ